MKRIHLKYLAGFSLIELVVSVAILGALASIAIPVVEHAQKREKEAQFRLALREIRHAIDAYKDASDQKRITVASGESGYPPNLEILVTGVPDLGSKTGSNFYFLRRIPRDPFSLDKGVTPSSSWRKRSFASSSTAPSEGSDVFDIYSSSSEVGMNGIPYKEW